MFPRFATFKEGTNLTYGSVFYFPASVILYARTEHPYVQNTPPHRHPFSEIFWVEGAAVQAIWNG